MRQCLFVPSISETSHNNVLDPIQVVAIVPWWINYPMGRKRERKWLEWVLEPCPTPFLHDDHKMGAWLFCLMGCWNIKRLWRVSSTTTSYHMHFPLSSLSSWSGAINITHVSRSDLIGTYCYFLSFRVFFNSWIIGIPGIFSKVLGLSSSMLRNDGLVVDY